MLRLNNNIFAGLWCLVIWLKSMSYKRLLSNRSYRNSSRSRRNWFQEWLIGRLLLLYWWANWLHFFRFLLLRRMWSFRDLSVSRLLFCLMLLMLLLLLLLLLVVLTRGWGRGGTKWLRRGRAGGPWRSRLRLTLLLLALIRSFTILPLSLSVRGWRVFPRSMSNVFVECFILLSNCLLVMMSSLKLLRLLFMVTEFLVQWRGSPSSLHIIFYFCFSLSIILVPLVPIMRLHLLLMLPSSILEVILWWIIETTLPFEEEVVPLSIINWLIHISRSCRSFHRPSSRREVTAVPWELSLSLRECRLVEVIVPCRWSVVSSCWTSRSITRVSRNRWWRWGSAAARPFERERWVLEREMRMMVITVSVIIVWFTQVVESSLMELIRGREAE